MVGRRPQSRDQYVQKTMPDGTVRTYPAVALPSGAPDPEAIEQAPVGFDVRQVLALVLIIVGSMLVTFASGALWGVWAGVLLAGVLITLIGVLLAME